jgi:mannosyl-oligosaccharide glucosidase
VNLQFVKHIGYVAFFPLFLKLVPVDSPKLDILLDAVETHLFTRYGLRSLSPKDSYYERPNAPGDAPYWRGAIWINLNYLAVDSFQFYAKHSQSQSTRERFADMYQKLRHALVDTIFNEYAKSGYFYEQYNQETGKGQRCHPFTGWTALVVNILTEAY